MTLTTFGNRQGGWLVTPLMERENGFQSSGFTWLVFARAGTNAGSPDSCFPSQLQGVPPEILFVE